MEWSWVGFVEAGETESCTCRSVVLAEEGNEGHSVSVMLAVPPVHADVCLFALCSISIIVYCRRVAHCKVIKK